MKEEITNTQSITLLKMCTFFCTLVVHLSSVTRPYVLVISEAVRDAVCVFMQHSTINCNIISMLGIA